MQITLVTVSISYFYLFLVVVSAIFNEALVLKDLKYFVN